MRSLREKLAALAHEQWSGWMRYLFSKCTCVPGADGARLIPRWAVERWQRQMATPYDGLPEKERDRMLAAVTEDQALVSPIQLKDALVDWMDVDGAQHELGRLLGLVDPKASFQDTKHFWWTENETGSVTVIILEKMVSSGFLEFRTEPDIQYRWKKG